MKTTRYTEERIIGMLKEAEAGAKTKELCWRHGISEATFYNWKANDGGGGAPVEGTGSREHEAQTFAGRRRARQCGAEGSTGPKMVSPQAKREAVTVLMVEREFGVPRACGLAHLSRYLYRYRSRRPGCAALRERLIAIAAEKRRYGYRRVYLRLRREGFAVNRKRVYRLYREAGLAVRRRKRIGPFERKLLPKPLAANLSWSMDFVEDGLADGRRLSCLTIVDDCTRECLAIESIPGSPARASRRCSSSWPKRAGCRTRSPSIMDLSLKARC